MIELKGKVNKDCKIFIDEIEEGAYSLIQGILDSEVSKDVPVRIMPDVHVGVDIVIGFTMGLTGMVNPNHVGVDIGCGLLMGEISQPSLDRLLKSNDGDMTKMLAYLDTQIRKHIPMGNNYHSNSSLKKYKMNDMFYKNLNKEMALFHEKWCKTYEDYGCPTINEDYIKNLITKIGIKPSTYELSIGTLGGGEMIAIRIG